MTLSIIIPVYNAAPYLEACVASLRALCAEGGIEAEIVMVDDGSTDESPALCDQLADRVLHQPNGGVSVARNQGMTLAQGEWLWFVDADDYVEKLANQVALLKENSISAESCDFVNLGFVWEEAGEAKTFGASAGEIPYNLWRCWFSRAQVEKHGVRFTVGRKYAEDQEFILRYLLSVKGCRKGALPEVKYHYTLRPGSAMTRPGAKQKMLKDILSVIGAMWGCALSHGHLPKWIWHETKRMLKSLYVTLKS